jgi:hypothetical protein
VGVAVRQRIDTDPSLLELAAWAFVGLGFGGGLVFLLWALLS